MSKYRTRTIYYPHKNGVRLGDGVVGAYINQLLEQGHYAIQIINTEQPHAGHKHGQVETRDEPVPYTAIQGNVGSS